MCLSHRGGLGGEKLWIPANQMRGRAKSLHSSLRSVPLPHCLTNWDPVNKPLLIILRARAYVSTRPDPLRGRCLLWRNSQQQPLTAHEKVLYQGEPRPLGEWRRVVTHSQEGSNCPPHLLPGQLPSLPESPVCLPVERKRCGLAKIKSRWVVYFSSVAPSCKGAVPTVPKEGQEEKWLPQNSQGLWSVPSPVKPCTSHLGFHSKCVTKPESEGLLQLQDS